MKSNDEHASQSLWQVYKDIYFAWMHSPLPGNRFYIVTAWNPRSASVSAEQNRREQSKFTKELARLGIRYALVRAGNQDFSYYEESLAIDAPLSVARSLAQKYEQNAIYECEGDTLRLIPIMMPGHTTEEIGSFSSRCRQVRAL